MKINEILLEGGWEDEITQHTKITPQVVKQALSTMNTVVSNFNKFLEKNGIAPVTIGSPTGSSAYYKVDVDDKEYGDIDLQVIVPNDETQSESKLAAQYSTYIDKFINEVNPSYMYNTGKPSNGHVIVKIGDNDYVQVDMMWMSEKISDWGRWRKTPEQGIKGMITGNMFSTLGEIMSMSIQGNGVEMKTKNDTPVKFSLRKDTQLNNLSTDISNFGIDIVKKVYEGVNGNTNGLKIHPELNQYPGLKKEKVRVTDLAHTVKGVALTFELNDLYGKYNLTSYNGSADFIQTFLDHFIKKAEAAKGASKFNKAKTEHAKQKVNQIKNQIDTGVNIVKQSLAVN